MLKILKIFINKSSYMGILTSLFFLFMIDYYEIKNYLK